MAIIYQLNKRTGNTYAYESKAYWDKEKKMSRAKRTLIGRLNTETGEIMPTDGRGRKDKIKPEKETDYKALYEKLLKEVASKDILIAALQKQIKQ